MSNRLVLILSLTLLATSSFASCRDLLLENALDIKNDRKKTILPHSAKGVLLGAPLIAVSAPLGAGFVGLLVVDIAMNGLQIRDREKLITAIDDSYQYMETEAVGRMLRKMNRKVSRKAGAKIDMTTLAEAIIDANENGDLCLTGQKNIRKQSKRIAIDLAAE